MGTSGGVLRIHAPGLGRRPLLEAVCQGLHSIHERLYLHLEPLQALFRIGPASRVLRWLRGTAHDQRCCPYCPRLTHAALYTKST
jgi:hypothetical protein